jgi:hypothetical protein
MPGRGTIHKPRSSSFCSPRRGVCGAGARSADSASRGPVTVFSCGFPSIHTEFMHSPNPARNGETPMQSLSRRAFLAMPAAFASGSLAAARASIVDTRLHSHELPRWWRRESMPLRSGSLTARLGRLRAALGRMLRTAHQGVQGYARVGRSHRLVETLQRDRPLYQTEKIIPIATCSPRSSN